MSHQHESMPTMTSTTRTPPRCSRITRILTIAAATGFAVVGCTGSLPKRAANEPAVAPSQDQPAPSSARLRVMNEAESIEYYRGGDVVFENRNCTGAAAIRYNSSARGEVSQPRYVNAIGLGGTWWRANPDNPPLFDTYQSWVLGSGECALGSGPTTPNHAAAELVGWLSYVPPARDRPDALLFPDWLFFPEKLME